MRRKDIERLLKENGYVLVRHTKHFIWSNGERTIVLSNNNFINPGLAKDIVLQINKRKNCSKTHRMSA